MPPSKNGSIYALSDPRDGVIRYIGKTTQGLAERLAGHLASPTNPAMRVWINGLTASGSIPRIRLVTTAPVDQLDSEEQRQIERHAAEGHPLLNSPHYRRNLAGLLESEGPKQAVAGLRERSRRAKESDAAWEKMGRTLFLDLAHRRAVTREPRAFLFFLVAAMAPVVALWALWSLLVRGVGHTAARRLRALAMAGFYLWTIGCDRMVRDLVLPRLPTAEIAAFWHTYLASPAVLIGWHASAAAVLMSAVMYHAVASELAAPPAAAPRPAPPAARDTSVKTPTR